MTKLQRRTVGGLVDRLAGDLRFPHLFLLTGAVFLLNLFIPDALPFADEIFLGLVTLLMGSWKDRRADRRSSANDVSETGDGETAMDTQG